MQQLDGGNPLMSQQNTSMVPYNPSTGVGMQPAQQGGFRAEINGVDDVRQRGGLLECRPSAALDGRVAEHPSLGGITGSNGTGGTSNWLRTGLTQPMPSPGFNGRNIRRKLDDHDDALTDSRDACAELDNLERSGIGTAGGGGWR